MSATAGLPATTRPLSVLVLLALVQSACITERDPVPPEMWCHETAGTVEVKAVTPKTEAEAGTVTYVVVGDTQGRPLKELLNKRHTVALTAFKKAAKLEPCGT